MRAVLAAARRCCGRRPLTRHPAPLRASAEGVLYAKKDPNLPKHPEIDVPNLVRGATAAARVAPLSAPSAGAERTGQLGRRRLRPARRAAIAAPRVRAVADNACTCPPCAPQHVLKLMQSFKSKEFVHENFAWQHHYYFLTNEGIEYLREYLGLPAEIVPATLKKQTRAAAPAAPGRDGGDRRGYGGDRSGKEGAPGAYRPRFEGGGYGRGAPPS